jgi:hypothetical protein
MSEISFALQYINELSQQRKDRVFESEISTRAINGIQFAAAILYADYQGFRIIGRIPPWVRRLRKFPLTVPPALLEGVRVELASISLSLENDGEILSLRGVGRT